jgi:hypothetical protein
MIIQAFLVVTFVGGHAPAVQKPMLLSECLKAEKILNARLSKRPVRAINDMGYWAYVDVVECRIKGAP